MEARFSMCDTGRSELQWQMRVVFGSCAATYKKGSPEYFLRCQQAWQAACSCGAQDLHF